MDSGVYMVYMTASGDAEAERLAETLVAERLAACVNTLGRIRTVYRWQGKVERGEEIGLVAKTAASSLDALTARVKDLHSYECPCIVAWPVPGGSPEFLHWVISQCGPAMPGG